MSEPRLEDISDYNTLTGEKKKVVLAVILAGLIIGVIYTVALKNYDSTDDMIEVEPRSQKIPMR
jgi:uncharacterized protein involved in exopolysaccharide biosynthesis